MIVQQKKKPKKKSLWGRQNWIVWLVAAMTTLLLIFAVGVTSLIIYARWNGEQQLYIAESMVAIDTPLPTPYLTPTPPEAIVVERNEVAKPSVKLTPSANGSVVAQYVNAPFIVDGDLAGWTDVPSYPSTFPVYQIGDWDESDDLQAFWRLAWDETNLYLAALVLDDVHVQIQTGNLIYLGDSLEVQLDTQRLIDLDDALSPDDFQLVLSPGDFVTLPPSAMLFRGTEEGELDSALSSGLIVSSAQIEGGYVMEAILPWDELNVRPIPDLELGIALNANDNDTPNTAQQEVMKSHVATRLFGEPITWGILILTGGNTSAE